MDSTFSLVFIEDNRLLRDGIAALIRHRADFPILAASTDGAEALAKIREVHPDVVLLDGSENHDSLRLAATIHAEAPEAKVVVMGLSSAEANVVGFVTAGVSGFLMKDATFEEFLATIHAVAGGVSVLPPPLAGTLFAQIAQRGPSVACGPAAGTVTLTRRERQVIQLISEGLSNKEIAARLRVAVHTAKSHVHHVLEKLALHSRLEVVTSTRLTETTGHHRKGHETPHERD